MAIEMKVPTVGESISEVTIAQWLKKTGDFVEMDEIIAELESDKATFELTAEAAGVLTTFGNEGDTIEIGAKICEIDTKEKESDEKSEKDKGDEKSKSESKSSNSESPKKPSSTGETIKMHVPTVGESINEVTISSWLKADGDMVALDDVIAEIESDKATFELTAEANGKLKIIAKEGATVEIGALICEIEEMDGAPEEAKSPSSDKGKSSSSIESSSSSNYAANHASPAAAKILSEKGMQSGDLKGTGVGGRITKEDAMNAEKAAKPAASTAKAASEPAAPQGDRSQRREKMTSLRKTISRRLVAVKNETAMLTTFNEVNMQPIMDLRKKYKDAFKEKYEVGLGFMSFFAKACSMALEEWPAVNATIDGEEIVYNNYCDISVAVSTPRGLVVPVVRNAEQLSFAGIEKEIIALATKARDGKLSIEEMTGGTFTITNGGVFGSMLSTPIINAPQSAILGMHNIVERPVAENGVVVIRPIMYVALSYDHRIVDGKESVSFLVRVKQLLEDPSRLLLGI
jgi:2-oxoglutarate dehydrogenase E2 component (dihydrolipoamide succinyltransferase)